MIELEQEPIKENSNNNIIKNDRPYYRKNKFKKDVYDEEDLIMQKILTEDFPKKCKDENRFIRISKYEYSFGEEKIKVIYRDGDVVLQLDEGDYKLQEFIDILNEGKNEEENLENDDNDNDENNMEINAEQENENQEIHEEIEKKQDDIINNDNKEIIENDKIENNSEKSDKDNTLNSEKKHKKRRKKRVSEDNSFEKEKIEKLQNSENKKEEKEEKKEKREKKEIIIEKEIDNNYNSEASDIYKISNTEGNESDINSENKGRKYVIKRRRDYKEKKLK